MISLHNQSKEYVSANFQALIDALLPPANQFGYGTNDLQAHEYVIEGLNQYISLHRSNKLRRW